MGGRAMSRESSEQGAAYMSSEQVRGRKVAALLVGSGYYEAGLLQISRKSTRRKHINFKNGIMPLTKA